MCTFFDSRQTIDATVGFCTAIHFARIHATRHPSFQPQQQEPELRLALSPGVTGVTQTLRLGNTGNVISPSTGGRREATTTAEAPSIPEEELAEWDAIDHCAASSLMPTEEGSQLSEDDSIRNVRTVSRAIEYAVNHHIHVLPTTSNASLQSDDDAVMVPGDAKPVGNSSWSLAPSARVVPVFLESEDQEKPALSSPRTKAYAGGFIRSDGIFHNEKKCLSTVDEGC